MQQRVHSAKAWGPEGTMAASLCPWAQRIWTRQALRIGSCWQGQKAGVAGGLQAGAAAAHLCSWHR